MQIRLIRNECGEEERQSSRVGILLRLIFQFQDLVGAVRALDTAFESGHHLVSTLLSRSCIPYAHNTIIGTR
jgi:hypothetical protein